MLQKIRDNASGPLAYVVVAVITLVFGVWGIGSYFTPSADPVVASVGGADITRNQLQRGYDQRYQRLRQMMGDNFDSSMFSSDQLRRTVLQQMIDNEVLVQYARKAGYRVSDAALLGTIRENPQFHADGEFSSQRYRGLLAQAGIAPAQYEASLRQDIKGDQLRQEIAASAFAAPAEVDQAYRLANQERRLRYLAFDPMHYRDAVTVSDDDIQGYYQDHGDAFERPERVKLSYVSLDSASTAAGADEPDEKALRAVFEQNKAQFGEPERRSGALVRVPIAGDASTARETIQSLAAADGDLEARAAQADGVRYEAIDNKPRGDMDKAVAESLFTLNANDTSQPVKGQNAWYLVHLDEITPASEAAFDDPKVQTRLKAMAGQQMAKQAFADKAERLESLAYEAPNDLKTLADELGLDIQSSDWITREQGPGVGQYDAIRKASFSDAVVKDKLNSTPIQLGADRRVVLRAADHQSAERRPIDEVRDDIRGRVTARKAGEKAREAADAALDEAQSGKSLQALGNTDDATLEEPGFVRRSNRDLDAGILEAAFSVAKPQEDAPRYRIAAMGDGIVALVAVDAVREAGTGEEQTPRSQFADQQRDYISRLEYAVLGDYLRTQVDITINEKRIN